MSNPTEQKLSMESALGRIMEIESRECLEENIKIVKAEGAKIIKTLKAKQAEAAKYAQAFKEIDAYYNALKVRLDELNRR